MEAATETATAPDRPTATTDSYATDPACWGKIDENVRAYWARKGPESCQNKEANVKASERHYKHQNCIIIADSPLLHYPCNFN